MIFDTIPSSPTFNAYSEVATIDSEMDYLELVNGSTGWQDLEESAKQAHIINASKSLCKHEFAGELSPIVVTNECMVFPRTGLEYHNGTPVSDDVVPDEVHDYIACFIYTWIDTGKSISGGSTVGMVRKKKVDKVEIEYETGSGDILDTSSSDTCLEESIPEAWIADTMTTLGGVGTVPKVRTP